jgi:hypothetical protein
MMGRTAAQIDRMKRRRAHRVNSVRGMGQNFWLRGGLGDNGDPTAVFASSAGDGFTPYTPDSDFSASDTLTEADTVLPSDVTDSLPSTGDLLNIGGATTLSDDVATLESGSTADISNLIAQGGADVASIVKAFTQPSGKAAGSGAGSILSGSTGTILIAAGIGLVLVVALSGRRRR